MGTKRHFTIQRRDGLERTVVGATGQTHVEQDIDKRGKDGHFTDDGAYRRAIEQAVAENTQ